MLLFERGEDEFILRCMGATLRGGREGVLYSLITTCTLFGGLVLSCVIGNRLNGEVTNHIYVGCSYITQLLITYNRTV